MELGCRFDSQYWTTVALNELKRSMSSLAESQLGNHRRHGVSVTWPIPAIKHIDALHSTNYTQLVKLGLKIKTKIRYQIQDSAKYNTKSTTQVTMPGPLVTMSP